MQHLIPRRPAGLTAVAIVWGFVALGAARGEDAVPLVERFRPGHAYKVDVQVKLDGKLSVPAKQKGAAPQLTTIAGVSRLTYDERTLDPDEANGLKTVRIYREVEFRRRVGADAQTAGVRPSVRRMVVIRSGERRAPFSPDGPLTWGEIDLVRTDVYNPVVVPGLLPIGAVKPGQSWPATAAAVVELTDMEKVEEGGLSVEFVGLADVNGRRMARLRVFGTVKGVNEDGPNRQKLDGTAYFDTAAGTLTYLSIRGTHELLDGGSGQTVGVIEGQFTMTRAIAAQLPVELSDASLRGLSLRPEVENTLLLHDDPQMGARFLYPRGWRVGAVQGRQVTLDHARAGAGILLTLEPAGKVPTADDYLRETTEFLQKEKAAFTVVARPSRARPAPIQLDRFTLDVVFDKEAARMEYAVISQVEGGATVAARLPQAAAADLRVDVERVVRSLSLTRRIEPR